MVTGRSAPSPQGATCADAPSNRIGADCHELRPKRIGAAWQQLRVSAATVIEWLRVCYRQGWLGKHGRHQEPRQRTSKRVLDQTQRARERLGRWGGDIAGRRSRATRVTPRPVDYRHPAPSAGSSMPPISSRAQIRPARAVCRGLSGQCRRNPVFRERSSHDSGTRAGILLSGGDRIRTCVGRANGFTARLL